jgi:L-serine/L-threonine ammonia-lyase
MAVKECYVNEEPQQSPWVQTPLRESYALSEAAGWYGHTSSSPVTLHPSMAYHVINFEEKGVLNRRSRIFLKLENLQPSGSFKSR